MSLQSLATTEEEFATASNNNKIPTNNYNDMTDLERTIYNMEHTQICADPRHSHSFQTVNFMINATRKCAACDTRLQSVVFSAMVNDSSKQIVKCAACGRLAHRTCAQRYSLWKEPCLVNKGLIEAALLDDSANGDPSFLENTESNTSGEMVRNPSMGDSWNEEEVDETTNPDNDNPKARLKKEQENEEEPPLTMEWTTEGPPQHWATAGDVSLVVPTITIPASVEATHDDDNNGENSDEVYVTPLHHADHPFASVSRVLQENILAHFLPNKRQPKHHNKQSKHGNEDGKESNEEVEHEDNEVAAKYETLGGSALSVSQASAVNAERDKKDDDQSQQEHTNALSKLGAAVRTAVNLPSRLGMAAVAGGIAGGVAGLAMAGPAGAYAGFQLGKSAGALGVILEGSVSIGVIVASVATASYTANKIQDHIEERRVLTMGEEGTSRKVLLVRPNIQIDPTWNDICRAAKKTVAIGSGNTFFFNDSSTLRERYQRDSDIIQQPEQEIPTPEKVLLLASRILNDKNSVPGHLYRSLIATFRARCSDPVKKSEEDFAVQRRRRRDDAHAVIKHVTGTLLEERPGFGHSPALTELTATAVEGFVFGQVYNLVFEEIQAEVAQKDADLTEKIIIFERTQPDFASLLDQISEDALQALRMLPTSSAAVEKLSFCTTFLERISEHFAKTSGNSAVLCADSLLKMVCQHILVAKIHSINAEVAFLEEFARDEQLLRGREGYALVTLQAALHFLNLSTDLENDIFGQDDNEKNVPVEATPVQNMGSSSRSNLGESGELL